MDEVIAVHGRIFACCLIDFVCFLGVPVDVGDDRRDGLAAIIQLQIFVETLGLFCSSWVGESNILHFTFVINGEDDIVNLVDVISFFCSGIFPIQIDFQLVVGIMLHSADCISFAGQIPFCLFSFRIVDGNLETVSLCQGCE